MSETNELYSVKEVSRIFEVPERQLRYWAQTGLVGPSVRRGNQPHYTFADLIGVKVASELLFSGVAMDKVRRLLSTLPPLLLDVDRPLDTLRIVSNGETISLRDGDEDGNVLLSFQVATLLTLVHKAVADDAQPDVSDTDASALLPAGDAPPQSARGAFALFQAGLTAETRGDVDRAEKLYRRACAADPKLAPAWTNLGNLLESKGARGEALRSYQRALAVDPDQAEARYNLANLLADAGEELAALSEYRMALSAQPEFADAHFNLALLYIKQEDPAPARKHLETYLRLDPTSDWADKAREALASLQS